MSAPPAPSALSIRPARPPCGRRKASSRRVIITCCTCHHQSRHYPPSLHACRGPSTLSPSTAMAQCGHVPCQICDYSLQKLLECCWVCGRFEEPGSEDPCELCGFPEHLGLLVWCEGYFDGDIYEKPWMTAGRWLRNEPLRLAGFGWPSSEL